MEIREISRSLRAYLARVHQITRWRIYVVLLLWVLSGATDAFGLMLLVPLLNTLSGQQALHAGPVSSSVEFLFKSAHVAISISNILLVGLCLTIFRALLARKRTIVMADLRFGFVMKLQLDLFEAARATRWSYWIRQRSSDFLHVLTTEIPAVADGTYYFLHLGVTLFMALAFWLVALRLSFVLTLCASLTGAILFLLLRGYLKQSFRLGRSINQASIALYDNINLLFHGLKFAKSHGESRSFTAALANTVQQLTTECLSFAQIKARATMVQEIGGAAILCGFVYGAYSWFHTPVATIMLLILIFSRLLPMMASIFSDAQQVLHMLPAFRSVEQALQSCLGAIEPAGQGSGVGLPTLQEGIRLLGVSAQYETGGKLALSEVDCMIPANQTTALIGPSGSGKTTVVDLITGLLQPSNGQILIDGRPLASDNLNAWGRQISYLPQDVFLFYGSVRDNLTYLVPDSSDSELWSALRLAAADTFVRRLPNGLDTLIGDQGITLSGGERQRLALARALLRKPSLLILDEATSALDSLNEQLIMGTLKRLHGKATIILIAHRLATIQDADKIIVLDDGRISGVGSWQDLAEHAYVVELMRMQSAYHKVRKNSSQASSTNWCRI